MKKTLVIVFMSAFAFAQFASAADQQIAPKAEKTDAAASVRKFKKKKHAGKKGHKKGKKHTEEAPAAAPMESAPPAGGAAPTNP